MVRIPTQLEEIRQAAAGGNLTAVAVFAGQSIAGRR